jgi:CubicO group peptidase (beta-lactamase class C family)
MRFDKSIGGFAVKVLALGSLLIVAGANAATPESGLPKSAPERVGMSAERLDRIKPAMQKYIDQQLVAGTVTIVARNGKVVHFESQGYMDAENKTPMRKDALFRIASMTKPITSVALMMLWEEGKFQLNDPVSKFLPEFKDQKVNTAADASGRTGSLVPVKRPATIRDMLTHTAGMANSYRGSVEYYDQHTAVRPDDTTESFVKRLASVPLNYHPGDEWQYSHATDVVGRLVEVISGQTLDDFFKQRIFKPLGMNDTHFYLDDTKGGRLTAQYSPGEGGKIKLQDPGNEKSRWLTGNKKVFRGAGGLVSTAHDYIRYQQMVANGGELEGIRLLSPMTVSLMIENHTGDLPLWLPGPGMGFGLGYAVVTDRGAAGTSMSLGSAYWGGAFCTLSWFDPKQNIVAAVFTQVRPYNHINIRQDFQNIVYQAIVK